MNEREDQRGDAEQNGHRQSEAAGKETRQVTRAILKSKSQIPKPNLTAAVLELRWKLVVGSWKFLQEDFVTFCSASWSVCEPNAGSSATSLNVKVPVIEFPVRVVLQFDTVAVAFGCGRWV